MIICYLKLVTKVIIIITISINKTILYLYFSHIKDFKNGTYFSKRDIEYLMHGYGVHTVHFSVREPLDLNI